MSVSEHGRSVVTGEEEPHGMSPICAVCMYTTSGLRNHVAWTHRTSAEFKLETTGYGAASGMVQEPARELKEEKKGGKMSNKKKNRVKKAM